MYEFRLKAVLNHRKFLEDNLQKDLGLLKKVLVNERTKLSDLKKDRKDFSKELQKKQQKQITVSEALLYVKYIEQLSKRLDLQIKKALNAEKEVITKREELIEAVKNKKILEKLRSKRYELYKHYLLRKEQAFINEMAAVRFKSKIEE